MPKKFDILSLVKTEYAAVNKVASCYENAGKKMLKNPVSGAKDFAGCIVPSRRKK
jgi:hypothetical protein